MAFIDECKIFLKAGSGGNGIVAWRREAHVPLGGPAGGDGGDGGSIYFCGNHNENSLQNLKYIKKVVAKNGENGQIKTMHGKNAEDIILQVPIGTIVYDNLTNEIIADIKEHGQTVMICKGGKGGFGNFHFKSGMNKNPTLFENGDKGEEKECKLVLKHIADIGIVGLPNAGKSTFISKISAAKPKTANYQFTTLVPVLGVVYKNNKKIIFADIPGLIEGASQGLGLGHDFLKHIERTSILVHIVSMDENDAVDPYESYVTIMNELKSYSPELIKKPMIVVANKMDAKNAEHRYLDFCKKINNDKVIKIIAELSENVQEVVDQAYNKLQYELNNNDHSSIEIIKYKDDKPYDEKLSRELKITKVNDDTWEVECEFIKYWAYKIPLSTEDNIIRFNQKMKTAKIEETLKTLGAKKNDIIRMYGVEMQYED